MSDPVKTPEQRKAAALAKRELQKKGEAEAFAVQEADDIERLVELEGEHGFERVLRIDLNGWKPGAGAATLVVARVPFASEKVYKRFEETVSKPKAENLKAAHALAEACLVYPHRTDDAALYAATLELAPGLLTHVANQIANAVQGRAEEEKKG